MFCYYSLRYRYIIRNIHPLLEEQHITHDIVWLIWLNLSLFVIIWKIQICARNFLIFIIGWFSTSIWITVVVWMQIRILPAAYKLNSVIEAIDYFWRFVFIILLVWMFDFWTLGSAFAFTVFNPAYTKSQNIFTLIQRGRCFVLIKMAVLL